MALTPSRKLLPCGHLHRDPPGTVRQRWEHGVARFTSEHGLDNVWLYLSGCTTRTARGFEYLQVER